MTKGCWLGSLSSLALLTALGCDPGADADSLAIGQASQPILNGNPISKGQFPTVVAVVVGQGGLCTGTLVAPDVILTAAHCISPQVLGYPSQSALTNATRIVFDSTDIFSGAGGFLVEAAETIPHPSFTRPGQPDIGIIRLAERVTDRQPTPINLDPAAAPIGISLTMVGYGLTEDGGSGAGYYLQGQQSTACSSYGVSDASFLCFNQEAGFGKCSGDSGGPSFGRIQDKDVLVGVTSFGDQNCQFFGADFRVDAGRDFIAQNAPELLCAADDLCDPACGKNGNAADPDCAPACVTDGDCGADSVCNAAAGVCEPAPFSPGGLGASCGQGLPACASGLCATGDDGSFCTAECASDDECPDGFECQQASNGVGVCWAASDSGGCQAGGRSGGLMAAVLGLALLALRRRRAIA